MAILLLEKPYVMVGLGSNTITLPSAGIYNVHAESTENVPSGVVLTVTNTTTSTTIYTSPTITPTQGAFQFKQDFVAAANNVITVALTSSAAIDSQLNTVKTTITIGQGA